MIINKLSHKLANNPQDEEILNYILPLVFQTIIIFLLTFIISYLLETLNVVLFVALSGIILRQISGGSHSKSIINCTLISVVMINLFSYLSKYTLTNSSLILILGSLTFIIGIIIVYKNVPVDVPERPITDPLEISKFRKLSFIYIFIIGILSLFYYYNYIDKEYYIAIVLGTDWQLFMLTSFGFMFNRIIDKMTIRKC